ncbi:MAG: BACON domain-containing protein [Bacteroidales bacterium]|nr:BACON domain-containing protein [Bacteroidales bacterium]
MALKRLLFLGCLLLLFDGMLFSQEKCYERLKQKGIELFNQGEYKEAAKKFEAAKFCSDLPSDNDLDTWLKKCVIVVKLSVKNLSFNATDSEEQCVEVNTNAKSFRVGSTPSWCKVTQQGKNLVVSCEDNVAVVPREARITVTAGGQTSSFEVNQRAADIEVDFQPDHLEFSSKQETQQVVVSTNATDWQIETVPSWLIAERKADTLYVASSVNSSSSFREDEVVLIVSGDHFPLSVRQLPGDTVIYTNQQEIVFPSEAQSSRLKVVSNITTWKADPSEKWIGVTVEHDSVTVFASENMGLFSRHGVVRFKAGQRSCEVAVHQAPHVSSFVKPVSELQSIDESSKELITVTSIPSDLRVYIDDTIARYTPFSYHVDYEHHSLLMGFERRDCFFNDKQEDIIFEPGLRFAAFTITAPKVLGLMSGFVSANSFGAFVHVQSSTPFVKEYSSDGVGLAGYRATFGAVYQPIQYLGIYAGMGGSAVEASPYHFGFDFEAGLMGFYKNLMLTMGFHSIRFNAMQKRTTFQFGIGGYLKRYYDETYDYCCSDSRRWWSLNYVFRPAQHGKGIMFGDLGKEKLRAYIKAMYLNPSESVRSIDASAGVVFTPVNSIIDMTLGVGATVNVQGLPQPFQGINAELGAILNFWRFPVTFMLHEADLFGQRHLYVDFGIGFHLGEFNRFSYK